MDENGPDPNGGTVDRGVGMNPPPLILRGRFASPGRGRFVSPGSAHAERDSSEVASPPGTGGSSLARE